MSSIIKFTLLLPFLMVMVMTCQAFNPPVDESAQFRVEIQTTTQVEVAKGLFNASLKLANKTAMAMTAVCEVFGVDGWKVSAADSGQRQFEVPLAANEVREVSLQVTPATNSHSALYPLHVKVRIKEDAEAAPLHAIAIVEAKAMTVFEVKPKQVAVVTPSVPLELMRITTGRVEIILDQGRTVSLPGGWTGQEAETKTTVSFDQLVTRPPKAAPAIAIHPPFGTGPGKARLTWRVNLPQATPITLSTALSIRDTHAPEPDSDGVTYRVLVDGQGVFEKHSDSKPWEEVRVDLSAFAGKEIDLALESDPGPKRDTTCDQSYWRQPWILAGKPVPEELQDDLDRESRLVMAQNALTSALGEKGKTGEEQGLKLFLMGEGDKRCGLAIVDGPHGLIDSAWAVGIPGKVVAFKGFGLLVEGSGLLDPLWGSSLEGEVWDGNRCKINLKRGEQTHWVSMEVRPAEQGFELKWDSDLPLTDISNGGFLTKAEEIYAGVGNVLKDPQASFVLEADGHRLSTRHVGLRFENDLSLVLACSNPPDRLVVDPERKEYTLHSHLAGSFYLVPSGISPFDAAIKYRGMIELTPGPGVKQLAGRFSFDLWGGHYAATAEGIEKAARYGLTQSVVVFHNWQRWGYDYRLPDIYPPNPDFGSLEDMKRLREVCRKNGILLAPHDNYIDIYPDCDDFSYDLVCFWQNGTPWKAWYNEGRKAQAYRFRPDKFLPILEKNLKLIRDGFAPDAYFIDVFSSIGAFDYWTQEGEFHSMNESRDHWCEAFDKVREILGGDAPQISESGVDWLIGHLDGAQCNHIGVNKGTTGFSWTMECADTERIPWQDAVIHDVFVLEGAGYSYRYAGGKSIRDHGIHSDDYISAEVLTGHPAMTDTVFNRASVRKYWLLHDFMNEIAGQKITSIEFVGDNIHRQKVVYGNGTQVWVNRGESIWTLPDGKELPNYGFWAQGPTTNAGIHLRNGCIAEEASGPQYLYADGRGKNSENPMDAMEEPMSDFGWCRTNAGIRLTRESKGVTITLLPGTQYGKLELALEPFGLPKNPKVLVELFDGSLSGIKTEESGGFISLMSTPEHFAYRVGRD